MATPKYAERVAILETKFDALKETVEVGFRELGEKIDGVSLNGETPRVKNISRAIGAPESVEILASLVEAHKRRTWLLTPLLAANGKIVQAALWVGTAAALAAAHSWLHSVVPIIP